MIFNSKKDFIPLLRADLDVYPVKSEERELIYFHDSMGYAHDNFVLQKELAGLLALMDQSRSVVDLHKELKKLQSDVSEDQVLDFIQHLDRNRILHSAYFKNYRSEVEESFEKQTERKPSCSGSSYPTDPNDLRLMLDAAFDEIRTLPPSTTAKALYAPHIDPRVGLASYVKAFAPLRDLKPSRVVILATSHYSGSYYPLYENTPFIASRKSYSTPLGITHGNSDLLDKLQDNAGPLGISFQDRAHRVEHSIEMHMVFLQYLWDHPFEIVPILVGSFDQLLYKENGHLGSQLDNMSEFIRKEMAGHDDTFILISGDLAHVGRKFGDREPASAMLPEVKLFDGGFLDHAANNRPAELLNLLSEKKDAYRICGFPPLLTFLKSMSKVKGNVTSYQVWDEAERESAVSFGSILYE